MGVDLRGVVPMRLRDIDPAINEITGDIIDSAIEVQRTLGSRLLERPYEHALSIELRDRGRKVETQLRCPAYYKGHELPDAFVIDMLVDDLIVVELKAVEALAPEHQGQLSTYLRFSQKPVGLLINFRAIPLKSGIQRLVGPRAESAASVPP